MSTEEQSHPLPLTLARYLRFALRDTATVDVGMGHRDAGKGSVPIFVTLDGEYGADLSNVAPILQKIGLPHQLKSSVTNEGRARQDIEFTVSYDTSLLDRLDPLIQEELIARIRQAQELGTTEHNLIAYWLDVAKKFQADRPSHPFDLTPIEHAAQSTVERAAPPTIEQAAPAVVERAAPAVVERAAPPPSSFSLSSIDTLPPAPINHAAIEANIMRVIGGLEGIAPTPAAPTPAAQVTDQLVVGKVDVDKSKWID